MRKHSLNRVKMVCCLLCQYIEMLESDETKPSHYQGIVSHVLVRQGSYPSMKKHNLNLVKMVCYLLCQDIEMLESDETKPSTSQVITKVLYLMC